MFFRLSETTDAVVFTLADTATELKNRAESVVQDEAQNRTKNQLFDQSEEVYIVRAEPKSEVSGGVLLLRYHNKIMVNKYLV